MKQLATILFLIFFPSLIFAQGNRWSMEKAADWNKSNPWFCGMNYIPSNAINYTAMWDKTSFSPQLIEKEMQLAEELGFNCARVVLQYAVYADDPEYFIEILDQFLTICNRHGVKVMPCFFDDCAFGVNTDPVIGKQPEPLEGWYAWAWSPSPGYTMVVDEREHPKLEKYVKDVIGHFKNDPRIFVWDLYNEPTNTTMPERSLPLVHKVFAWAREIDPVQPVSIAIWNGNQALNDIILANSDIITFHCYAPLKETKKMMNEMLDYNRPVICTEWMNRVAKSRIEEILPIFDKNEVGSMLWGLVNGKTQTHLSWGHRPEHLPYKGEWQHDLFTDDLQPYKIEEIELIKKLTGKDKKQMLFGDTSRRGVPFSKDPHVIKFKGEYLMYYSVPPFDNNQDPINGWAIGIAKSDNLIDWQTVGAISPFGEYDKKGLCAPSVLVIDGKVHLFYQTYGNWKNDAICHAVSSDGLHFTANPTNPIFHPTGDWTSGRAIDAEVIKFKDNYLLYFATRDTAMEIQMQGVASAPENTKFNREDWTQLTDEPILSPKYPWEGKCVEGASVIQRDDILYMFYAGAYNIEPQQVGVAQSTDGINWERLSNKPFLTNGDPGEWNYCESGHPHIFLDDDGRTYLFFQGNNDFGLTWQISQKEVIWDENGPKLK